MAELLLTNEGTIGDDVTIEQVYDHAMVDEDGRLLVSMIDVLALVRIAGDAQIVLVHFDNGASRAFRLPEIVDGTVFLKLEQSGSADPDVTEWIARLWSPRTGSSAPITSVTAMSFAAFVGQR